MLKFVLISLGIVIGGLIFAAIQRRFSSETLANGFMDVEKGKEVAPTVFKEKENSKK